MTRTQAAKFTVQGTYADYMLYWMSGYSTSRIIGTSVLVPLHIYQDVLDELYKQMEKGNIDRFTCEGIHYWIEE